MPQPTQHGKHHEPERAHAGGPQPVPYRYAAEHGIQRIGAAEQKIQSQLGQAPPEKIAHEHKHKARHEHGAQRAERTEHKKGKAPHALPPRRRMTRSSSPAMNRES